MKYRGGIYPTNEPCVMESIGKVVTSDGRLLTAYRRTDKATDGIYTRDSMNWFYRETYDYKKLGEV